MMKRLCGLLLGWFRVPEVKNFIAPIPDFIVCESYPGYSKHIRKVNADIHYGGFVSTIPRTALCGKELAGDGWDTRFPLPDLRGWCIDQIDRPCAVCEAEYVKQRAL